MCLPCPLNGAQTPIGIQHALCCLTIHLSCARLPLQSCVCVGGHCSACPMQWKTAVEDFAEMRAMGVAADVRTYTLVITAYSNGRAWRRARETFDAMQVAGVAPVSATYNALMVALRRAGRVQDVEGLLREMQEHGITPDDYTWAIVMQMYVQKSRWQDVEDTFEALKVALCAPPPKKEGGGLWGGTP